MELLIRLIEFIVRSALEQNKNTNAPLSPLPPGAQRGQASAQIGMARPQPAMPPARPGGIAAPRQGTPAHTHSTQASSQPLMAGRLPSSPDPAYDDRGWRLAVALLALVTLVIMVVTWLVFVSGL